jgi:hypothetical protein
MNVHATALAMSQVSLAAHQANLGRNLTREDIEHVVDELLQLAMFSSTDRRALIADLEERFTVWTGDLTVIGNDDDHQPWLHIRKPDIPWKFWDRYVPYLAAQQRLAPSAIKTIDKVSEEVLSRIEDPARLGPWDRRGLVMGNVQSGKTATYTGIICKAADAGYKVIVVLAGLHNNLRSQTQMRLDDGFLGFKAAPPGTNASFVRTGVSAYGSNVRADSVTNRSENGDFNQTVASNFGIHPGGRPLLFVVKKNKTVLENLLRWINSSADAEDPQTGRKIHKETPLIVIDDEADQASVDTRKGAINRDGEVDPEHDPTAINKLIRKLLVAFNKSAYVGFTATPFANIFIHEQARTRELGEDLFPRSFIVNLPASSNYTGAARVFGVAADEEIGLREMKPLPIFREVDDHAETGAADETQGWMPPKLVAKTEHQPLFKEEWRVPDSLRNAILSFIVSATVRAIREDGPIINSMLVHVVRFTNVQQIVAAQIEQETKDIAARLRLGDGALPRTILDEFEALWETDFVSTSAAMDISSRLPSWADVKALLPKVAATIRISVINGSAKDALDFEAHKSSGLNVIAIGGDKLSRGLTIEGLTTSYFLRSSKMYDTLMQMGRWFGYKEKYIDVCRLYSTMELRSWFNHVAKATEELRLEFDYMASVGESPKTYGLKVRSHPLMLITSAVKMRSGTELSLSYAGDISETIIFDTKSHQKRNFLATVELLDALEDSNATGGRQGGYLWRGASVDLILEFLSKYKSHPEARRADALLLRRFIDRQKSQGELVTWDILLASSSQRGARDLSGSFRGLDVGAIERSQFGPGEAGKHTIRRLVSPSDEWKDLSADEYRVALELTVDAWVKSKRSDKPKTPPDLPSGRFVRQARPKSRGLLIVYPLDPRSAAIDGETSLIGIAISFPASDTAKSITYTVNNVFSSAGDYESL